ncbi:40S ribosomal protein S4-3 [Zea mays]|uniref:40S ribosomal protein S4-3 n=1 Tax=Zea mays TaxID=4577 RepID=A0A1D6LXT6_MAIZE|nr:40S ribosomal protein S4-3 [Zea mays]
MTPASCLFSSATGASTARSTARRTTPASSRSTSRRRTPMLLPLSDDLMRPHHGSSPPSRPRLDLLLPVICCCRIRAPCPRVTASDMQGSRIQL